ncbi:uncharacterized protein [Miscanthus floridulus]|uniref:uncharacterized protein n=1 Tax=Miscanthus floridulus TaxID=154761 RepID=UPI00345B2E24
MTASDSVEKPGATVRAAESSEARAGAADIMPESAAQRLTASVEQAACPKMPQGVVGHCVRPPSPQAAPPAMEEEDGVEEIEREESQPQAVHILHKRDDEVVVMEEEDTTREVKRLRSTLSTTMKQIEGITRTIVQRQQLIKRMEPLAEENKKLKEAVKLMEKNIQRALRERDLAESNVRDLEYQKGTLSEQLKIVSEQLEHTSEQLRSSSE